MTNQAEAVELRQEFVDAKPARRAEIVARLMQLGEVVYPPGTPEYEAYQQELRQALGQLRLCRQAMIV